MAETITTRQLQDIEPVSWWAVTGSGIAAAVRDTKLHYRLIGDRQTLCKRRVSFMEPGGGAFARGGLNGSPLKANTGECLTCQRRKDENEIAEAIDRSGDGDYTCPHCTGVVDTAENVSKEAWAKATLACISCRAPLDAPTIGDE